MRVFFLQCTIFLPKSGQNTVQNTTGDTVLTLHFEYTTVSYKIIGQTLNYTVMNYQDILTSKKPGILVTKLQVSFWSRCCTMNILHPWLV